MKTNIDQKGDKLIIRLNGELDHHYATQVRVEIDELIMLGNVRKIIFDFSKVGFMDSSGIGVLMGRFKLMQTVGGNVTAFGVSKTVDKLLTMAGIKKIIKIYQTEQQAVTEEGK